VRVDVAELPPASTPNRTCLVVDVLRATSTIAVLMGRGIERVYPASSIEAARALRTALGSAPWLCGEVNALPPEGFNFGNSPSEFQQATLPGPEVVMATTNGTPALLACAGAPLVMAAAPLNASACVALALEAGHDVLVVAAGRHGEAADDDTLAAALLAARLVEAGAEPGEGATRAIERWERVREDLAGAFRDTTHGNILIDLGFGHDLDFCAQTDRIEAVGVLRTDSAVPYLERRGPAN